MEPGAPTPCRDLADRLLAARPPLERLDLALPGCRARIRGDDRGVMAELREYYREFLLSAASGPADLEIVALAGPPIELPWALEVKHDDKGRPAKEAWIDLADGRVVRKIRTGVTLLMGQAGGRTIDVIAGPLSDHADQVINFLHHRFMARALAGGGALAHAAAVAHQGRGLVLCGRSGAGKSTLALHLMAHTPALAFVSNDRLVLGCGDTPRILGIPKHPRVNPGTILNNPALTPLLDPRERAAFGALPEDELRPLEDKRDAVIDRLFGHRRFVLEASPAAALFLRWRPGGGEARIDEVDLRARPDLLPLLHKRLGLFFWPLEAPADEVAHAALIAALAHVPCFEVSGGIDLESAAAWVRERLGA
ncbi:MAG: HprK-related kinase B [Myxococcales bacterium]|nr:HprK-related kinase B [Myxococcales bacterium]